MKSANKIQFPINFQNPQIFIHDICELFFNVHKENMLTNKIEDWREAQLFSNCAEFTGLAILRR